jgi:HSP20 family protein
MAIYRWEPFDRTLSMRDAMNRLFDQSFWLPNGQTGGAFQAPMDVYTEGDGYVVEFAMPGIKPDDFDIEMTGDTLTVSGEVATEAPEGRQYLMRQRVGGKFRSSVTLPDAGDASKIKATYQHGVLRLEVPKSEAARPKRIALKAGK